MIKTPPPPYLNNQGPIQTEDNNKSIRFVWLFDEESLKRCLQTAEPTRLLNGYFLLQSCATLNNPWPLEKDVDAVLIMSEDDVRY